MPSSLEDLRAALAGRYEIERELGHGGMAIVYLAHDIRHDRLVAVKVVRPELAAVIGAERFLNEIKVTANLQHPHILPLFDSGEADGFLYYVMPYVEGESLRALLDRKKQLPIDRALESTKVVASALGHAHRHGVIHRDIKPENILLADDGQPLVADFGIALAVSEAGSARLTETGMSLGTPEYMSPEQATGDRQLEPASDIYSLGAVLYEMLTGEPPHTGNTAQAIISRIMMEQPTSIRLLRETVPEHVEQMVMKALAKVPADRWQSADEMLPHLEATAGTSGGLTPTSTRPIEGAGVAAPRRRVWMAAGAAAAVVVIAVYGGTMLRDDPLTITTSNIRHVTRAVEPEQFVALSPDGRAVAYQSGYRGDSHIEVRDVSGGRPLALTGDWDGAQVRPIWMPDGGSIVFLHRFSSDGHDAGLWKLPRMGGQAERPDSADFLALTGGWEMGFSDDSVFVMQPATGDTVLLVLNPNQSWGGLLAWRADGGAVAYVVGNRDYQTGSGNIAPSEIWVATIGGASVLVSDSTSLNVSPAWLPDGTLLFVSNRDGPRDIYAVRLDRDGAPREAPVRLTTGLEPYTISVSADGRTLAYDRFTSRRNIYAIPVPTSGSVSVREARPITTGNQIIEDLDVSADGQWLAFDSNLGGNEDIFVMPLAGGEPRRVTRDPGDDFSPSFSPDGREIAFYSTRNPARDVYVINADGSGEERLTSDEEQSLGVDFSPDGLAIVFANFSIFTVHVLRRETLEAPWQSPEQLPIPVGYAPQWSPDGSSLVYDVRRSPSGIEVFQDGGSPRRVVTHGTAGLRVPLWPGWSTDGRTIYFRAIGPDGVYGIYAVAAAGGEPRRLVRFDEPSMQVYRGGAVVEHDGMFYFAIGEIESDIYVMELEY